MPEGRPFWSGTITFGLVSVPVNLFPAYRSTRTSLRMVAEDGTPLERRYFCPAHEREVGRDKIRRGYEVEKGRYVPIKDEELEALQPEKTREIDLQRFVDRQALDPIFFERAYYLTPAGDVSKPYRLLARVMEESGRAGIARFVMRGKEYLIAILSDRGILRAETMRFHDELRGVEAIGLGQLGKTPGEGGDGASAASAGTGARNAARSAAAGGAAGEVAGEEVVALMRRAIESRAAKELNVEELEESRSVRLEEVVERKLKSGRDVVEPRERADRGAEEEAGVDEESEDTGVIDIMEVIKRNLAREGGQAPAKPRAGRGNGSTRPTREELEKETKDELYERARSLNVSGRSTMTKRELIRAIGRK